MSAVSLVVSDTVVLLVLLPFVVSRGVLRAVQRCCSVRVARQQSPPTLECVARVERTCTSATSAGSQHSGRGDDSAHSFLFPVQWEFYHLL